MTNIKEVLIGLQKNYWNINELWFKTICTELGFEKEAKKLFEQFAKGMFHFATVAPDSIINYIANIKESDVNNSFDKWLYDSEKNSKEYKKVIYEKDGKNVAIELNFLNAYDLANLQRLISTPEIKIIAVLKHIDEISGSKKQRGEKDTTVYHKVYEYDLLSKTETSWNIEKELYICHLRNGYSPSYRELIWTKKYGYFKSDGALHEDEKEFNLEQFINLNGNYSSYKVTGGDNYVIIGNLYTDSNLLKQSESN